MKRATPLDAWRVLAIAMELAGACALLGCRHDVALAPPARAGVGVELVIGRTGTLVRDRRLVVLASDGEVRFAGVPAGLDPASVTLVALDDPEGTHVLAHTVEQTAAGPALSWRVSAKHPGAQRLEVSYVTSGLSWQASYGVVLDEAAAGVDVPVDVSGQVALVDDTKQGFAHARVWLARRDDLAPVLLPERVSLLAGRSVTVPLFAARRLPVTRALVFDAIGAAGVHDGPGIKLDAAFPPLVGHDVRAFVVLANLAPGVVLPAGSVRFFRRAADGTLAWQADVPVDEVAPGGDLRVPLEVDASILGRRTSVSVDVDEDRHRLVEEIEVALDNRGAVAREVTVIERLARAAHWRLTWWSVGADEAHDDSRDEALAKEGARSVRFVVPVSAGSVTKLRYRVMYFW